MKKNRYKYHAVDVPLYYGGLHVLIGHDLQQTYDAAGIAGKLFAEGPRAGKSPDDYGAVTFKCGKDGLDGFFVLLRPNATPCIVAHEAVHLAHKIMLSRGIKTDPENDEPQAYLVGWLVEQIHYALTSDEVKAKKKIELR